MVNLLLCGVTSFVYSKLRGKKKFENALANKLMCQIYKKSRDNI